LIADALPRGFRFRKIVVSVSSGLHDPTNNLIRVIVLHSHIGKPLSLRELLRNDIRTLRLRLSCHITPGVGKWIGTSLTFLIEWNLAVRIRAISDGWWL
jgi:hypothetical protein